MMIDAIFSPTVRLMEKSMSLRMMRQGLLASNIANAETPNYRAIDVDFEGTMEKLLAKQERKALELKQTDPRHFDLEGVSKLSHEQNKEQIVFTPAEESTIGNDSNSVDLEAQVARSQENTLLYSLTAQLLAKKFKGMNNIIESTSRT